MRCFLIFVILLFVLSTKPSAQDDLESPCPRLFEYEKRGNESDKWYGIITLLSERDISGVWLRVILNRKALQLGNWFSPVLTTDNKEYLIRNRHFNFSAHTSVRVRFYIKYNLTEPVPKLQEFRLNGETVCPEEQEVAPPLPVENLPGGPVIEQNSDNEDFFQNELFNIRNRTQASINVANDFFQNELFNIRNRTQPSLNAADDFFQNELYNIRNRTHVSLNPIDDFLQNLVVQKIQNRTRLN